jgi:uncharacterized protein YcbX
VITLAALHIYPVKSCRGIATAAALLTDAGLEHDREWMIVTPEGRFVTQREEPRLARIITAIADGALMLSTEEAGACAVPLDRVGRTADAVVWRDRCTAFDQGDEPARWLSGLLGRELRLVRFDPRHERLSDRAWTGGIAARNRFSDGYALLAISRASLADLNARLPAPLPMNRFRPNLELDWARSARSSTCRAATPRRRSSRARSSWRQRPAARRSRASACRCTGVAPRWSGRPRSVARTAAPVRSCCRRSW